MRLTVDGIKKIEKTEPPSARFSVALGLEDGIELYLTGFRNVNGKIWPPAYVSGRRAWPILMASAGFRKALYEAVVGLTWPEGVPALREDSEDVMGLLKPDNLSLAKMFPNV
jgi:hypothetical protein